MGEFLTQILVEKFTEKVVEHFSIVHAIRIESHETFNIHDLVATIIHHVIPFGILDTGVAVRLVRAFGIHD